MADTKFIITEIVPSSGSMRGGERSGVKFTWDGPSLTAPRAPWSQPISVRKRRIDYPGSGANEPTIQVLGSNFSPFEISGRWQDRHAGAGFAKATMRAFEQLVQRANIVKIDCQGLRMYGLIDEFEPSVKTIADIGYKFRIEPTGRRERTLDGRRQTATVPTIKSPQEHHRLAREVATSVEAVQETLPAVHIKTDLGTLVGDAIAGWLSDLDVVELTVERTVGPLEQASAAFARTAQTFAHLKGSAFDTISRLAVVRAETDLAVETVEGVLAFDVWSKALARQARQMLFRSTQAERDLRLQAEPDILGVYVPKADESLYAISQRWYGSPHRWREIARRNGVVGPYKLTGTEVLLIPKLSG